MKKFTALLLAVLFLSCGSVGGTIAWMVCQTDAVINTFTYGKIDITLTETDTKLDEDDNDKTNTYQSLPSQAPQRLLTAPPS